MLFNSVLYIFMFLPIMFFGYFFLLKKRLTVGAQCWLVVGSLVFYSWWNPAYLPIILLSMLVNYAIGSELAKAPELARMPKQVSRRTLLIAGILFNVGLLGYFKYVDFFLENVNAAFGLSIPMQQIVLPLAISFFTFQQIAYLSDCYKRIAKETDLLNYALFIVFFPQLIAGPIVHHKEMMPQFASRWNMAKRHRNILIGLMLFAIGLFKKVVLADTFAIWADSGFGNPAPLGFFDAWATSLSYTFQLYFDFSGYTDMALGVAMLFNIRLPVNFDSPYKALDIQDFWRRWHITLGRFLRDYVYIPLGGNRKGDVPMYANLFVTFLIGGLWHGASWMFVIWGALHGGALVLHRIWTRLGLRMWAWLAWLVTFNFVNVAWVFFRAPGMEDAKRVLSGMVDFASIRDWTVAHVPTYKLAWAGTFFDRMVEVMPVGLAANILCYLMLVPAFVIIAQPNSRAIAFGRVSNAKVVGCAILFVLAVYVMRMSRTAVFLYFNF